MYVEDHWCCDRTRPANVEKEEAKRESEGIIGIYTNCIEKLLLQVSDLTDELKIFVDQCPNCNGDVFYANLNGEEDIECGVCRKARRLIEISKKRGHEAKQKE